MPTRQGIHKLFIYVKETSMAASFKILMNGGKNFIGICKKETNMTAKHGILIRS